MAAVKFLGATTSFACEVKGVEYVIRTGDVVPATHPVVKGREGLFEAARQAA